VHFKAQKNIFHIYKQLSLEQFCHGVKTTLVLPGSMADEFEN
jgi:hypothetical protein